MATSRKRPKVNRSGADTAGGPSDAPRSRYRTNYLKKVIAKIDFEPAQRLLPKHPPSRVKALLKTTYPYRDLANIREQRIEVRHEGRAISQTQTTTTEVLQWDFKDRKRERTISLNEKFVAITYATYTCFEDLIGELMPVVDAYLHQAERRINRIGLRYVNQIEFDDGTPPTNWTTYLSPNLLVGFDLADDPKTISRAFNVLEFNYGDDMSMRFQFGMPNPEYPAPISRKFFVLDWDAYCDNMDLPKDAVKSYLERFHEKINRSFEEVIMQPLREKMGVVQ
jgi:uncharacterized protein (TIGR04255 family)